MIGIFFLCRHCERPATTSSFPLCSSCASYLKPAPNLCQNCASPLCCSESECREIEGSQAKELGIRSYTALYLATEPGYSVLRTWKKHGGLKFDQRVLPHDTSVFENIRPKLKLSETPTIVSVPQKFARTWRLGRSPAEAIAGWLARGLKFSYRPDLLRIREGFVRRTHQAQLSLEGRLTSRNGFEASTTRGPKSVILVDDFMTSGRTLRSAARALRESGTREIGIFVLGYRPRMIR